VANLTNFDLIMLSLKGSQVVISSNKGVPNQDQDVSKLFSRSMDLVDEDLNRVSTHLQEYTNKARPYEDPSKLPLPPFWDINHTISLLLFS
jgi:hypothetical protein